MKTKFIEILIVISVLLLVAVLAGCKEKVEATEPNDPNFVGIIAWETEYPIDLTLSGGYSLNESVTFMLGSDNEIVCDGTREKFLNILYSSLSGKEPTEKVTLRFEED